MTVSRRGFLKAVAVVAVFPKGTLRLFETPRVLPEHCMKAATEMAAAFRTGCVWVHVNDYIPILTPKFGQHLIGRNTKGQEIWAPVFEGWENESESKSS